MSLLDVAAADLRNILGDATTGFALPITITDPDGRSAVVNGQQRDIGLSIDAQGAQILARTASVALSATAILAAGFDSLPEAVVDDLSKKWLIEFTAPTGGRRRFAVTAVIPDTLGAVVLILEDFQ